MAHAAGYLPFLSLRIDFRMDKGKAWEKLPYLPCYLLPLLFVDGKVGIIEVVKLLWVMNKLNRRKFLAVAGASSAAVTTGGAITLAQLSKGLTKENTLTFRAVAGLPTRLLPAYASYFSSLFRKGMRWLVSISL